MIGIFVAGCTLGAVKAVSHGVRRMPLLARVFEDTEALAMDSAMFLRELERDPSVYARAAVNFILKDEASIEGLILNDLLKIPERIAIMIGLAFRIAGSPLGEDFRPLPCAFTVTDIARMVHCTRVAASQTLAAWKRRGVVRTDGATWLFNKDLLRVVDAEDG